MYRRQERLETPNEFGFPFPPYNIQADMMRAVYEVLEGRQIGIFESPTGTGKSLTLTCAALRWLLDHEHFVRQELQERIQKHGAEISKLDEQCSRDDDWITAQAHVKEKRQELFQLQQMNTEISKYSEEIEKIRTKQKSTILRRKNFPRPPNKMKKDLESERDDGDDDNDDDHEDDDDSVGSDDDDEKETKAKCCQVRIFYCSRTHTQLAQVVEEIRRTEYGAKVSCVCLGSRQQLCVNPDVRKLGSLAQINERCLEMAKNKNKEENSEKHRTSSCSGKCSYRCSNKITDLRDYALANVLDIESLATAGEELHACSYYAARESIELAQVIMLPYQILLHRKTRQQTGIDLEDAIIIIDEAHNLLDSIAQMHSCQITLEQLRYVQEQIISYKMNYSKRFSTKNLLHINKLLFIVKRLNGILIRDSNRTEQRDGTRVLRAYELMSEAEFFNINLLELLDFCKRTRFAMKLQGYAKNFSRRRENNSKQNNGEGGDGSIPAATRNLLKSLENKHTTKRNSLIVQEQDVKNSNSEDSEPKKDWSTLHGAIFSLLSFLEALTEETEDGRVLLTNGSGLKYLLLNPGSHFQDIVREARSIIIAGGTMKPIDDLRQQLFSTCPERVRVRCYDHVIPDGAVMPFVVTKGPHNNVFHFNYEQRSTKQMLNELIATLRSLCEIVPGGLVCFFPSYEYLDTVYSHLCTVTVDHHRRITECKRIFVEPSKVIRQREQQLTTEEVLNQYTKAIRRTTAKQNGALLFGVMGGKLSEGLNFADDLGRGIIVVGLPYANPNCCELNERMNYLEMSCGVGSGRQYYENNCWKLINQCIGRSVRHIRDYASIYLLDVRFQRPELRAKLPEWISRHLQVTTTFREVEDKTKEFFVNRKQ